MQTRLLAATLALVLAAAVTTGCAPTPEPTEPTPLFTSEDEAFAAAEETYRAYVDALNQVDLSDPATFEDVYAWTTGDANANERKTFSRCMPTVGQSAGDTAIVVESRPASIRSRDRSVVTVDVASTSSESSWSTPTATRCVAADRPDVQTPCWSSR